jgi:predicted PurR-regulated permease PerM
MNQPPQQPVHKTFWSQFSTNTLVRFLLFFACGWVFVELFLYFQYVVFVFTFATILALTLNYPVRYLEKFLRRGIALGTVIAFSLLTIIVLFVAIGIALVTQFQQLAGLVLQILSSTNNPLTQLQNTLATRNIQLNLETLETQIRNWFVSGMNYILGFLPSVLENYVTFIIILVVAFFMLADGENLWQLILKIIPHHQRDRFATAIQKNFIGFLRGQLLISFILSVATFLVFLLFRIPFPFLLAVTVGVFDLIPGIGATLGVSLVCLVILVQSGWIVAIKVLIACIVLQQIQDNFVAPRVMQSTVHLNPVVVFFALLVGTRVAGLLGVFLSIPIAGVIVSLLEIEEMQG